MNGFIEITNERTEPKLVWIEPFGVPVNVTHGERLKIEFACDPSEILSSEFGTHHYLSFPPECQPSVAIQRAEEVAAIDLSQMESTRVLDPAGAKPDFRRLIDYLLLSIKTTTNFQIGDDCAKALNKIGNLDAIEALFCVYHDVPDCLVELLQPRIIYWLNLCSFDTPEKRAVGLNHLTFLHSLIAQTPNIRPESCRRAFYVMSKLQEQSSETLNLVISVIEKMADTTDKEWKITLDAAILFVQKRAPHLLRRNWNLWVSICESKVFDPMFYCDACNYRFTSPKHNGDICPECWFEFGVDDLNGYRRPKNPDGTWYTTQQFHDARP